MTGSGNGQGGDAGGRRSARSSRASGRNDAEEVEADFKEKDNASTDASNAFASASHAHRAHVPFYSRPEQMQCWGEAASHPHVDWGGLFYDLFYVAAAYNLGSVYISAIDDVNVQQERPLFLYVIAAFGAIWMTWYNTVAYNARFSVRDYTHRILHVLRIVAISLSIVHIKSFRHFSDPRDPTMFNFLVGLFIESVINFFLWVEIWSLGRGGPEMREEAKFTIVLLIIPQVALYLVAGLIAGNNAFSPDADYAGTKGYRSLGEEKDAHAGPSFVSFTNSANLFGIQS